MPNYQQWNAAIVEYVCGGVPGGTGIYLSIDDEAIAYIGREFLGQSYPNEAAATLDFVAAIRNECLTPFGVNTLSLDRLISRLPGYAAPHVDEEGEPQLVPKCAAFLAAMVLAAHRMFGEETEDGMVIDEKDYFIRLREVLRMGLDSGGRPAGLKPAGAEEPLWRDWNGWLRFRQWDATAESGDGAYRYLNYPLSQALLRGADKVRLEQRMRKDVSAGNLAAGADRISLNAWVRTIGPDFPSKRLRALAQEADPRRFAAFVDAAAQVYRSVDWSQSMEANGPRRFRPPTSLTAGLYRLADYAAGVVEYLLYPEQPRHSRGGRIEAVVDGKPMPLDVDRPGHFRPLGPARFWEPTEYAVRSAIPGVEQSIRTLTLPACDFWVLTSDPDDPDSDIFATWKLPEFREKFHLLCRAKYAPQLDVLKHDVLLTWGEVKAIPGPPAGDPWIEYRDCSIVSPAWDEVLPKAEARDLFQAIRPRASGSVCLEGGLRAPHETAWLEGAEPAVKVYTADPNKQLSVEVHGPRPAIYKIDPGERLPLEGLGPGDHAIEVRAGRQFLGRRTVRVVPYRSLRWAAPERVCETRVGPVLIRGATIATATPPGEGEAAHG